MSSQTLERFMSHGVGNKVKTEKVWLCKALKYQKRSLPRTMPRKLQSSFLFTSLEDKAPPSARKVHIRRLADLLCICIHRQDWNRAGRAWSILTRCPEFDWQAVWQFGILFASSLLRTGASASADSRSLEYLRIAMLRLPLKRVAILQEIVIQLINQEQYRQALEELELYIPSFPYQEDIILNVYAALLHLYSAFQAHTMTSSPADNNTLIQNHIRECKAYLRRASELGKDHPVPNQILQWLESNSPSPQRYNNTDGNDSESDV